MWPFKKKKQPELSCVAQSVLNDLSKYPNAEWNISNSKGCFERRWYEVFSHPKVPYSLHTCLMDRKGDCVAMLGINNAFTYYDQCVIWDKLYSIQEEQDNARREAKKQSDERKLKQMFPQCYEKP